MNWYVTHRHSVQPLICYQLFRWLDFMRQLLVVSLVALALIQIQGRGLADVVHDNTPQFSTN